MRILICLIIFASVLVACSDSGSPSIQTAQDVDNYYRQFKADRDTLKNGRYFKNKDGEQQYIKMGAEKFCECVSLVDRSVIDDFSSMANYDDEANVQIGLVYACDKIISRISEQGAMFATRNMATENCPGDVEWIEESIKKLQKTVKIPVPGS